MVKMSQFLEVPGKNSEKSMAEGSFSANKGSQLCSKSNFWFSKDNLCEFIKNIAPSAIWK
jgi:hypothetical protein